MKKKNHFFVIAAISFVFLLQLTFIILKICKVITWSWLVVMLPDLIVVGVIFLAYIALIIQSEIHYRSVKAFNEKPRDFSKRPAKKRKIFVTHSPQTERNLGRH